MHEFLQRHWWVIIITIPLLAYTIFYCARRARIGSDSLLHDTRPAFVCCSLLAAMTVFSMLTERDQFTSRAGLVFFILFLICLNGLHFALYSKARKLNETRKA